MNTLYASAVSLLIVAHLVIWGLYGFSFLGWAAGAALGGLGLVTGAMLVMLVVNFLKGSDE